MGFGKSLKKFTKKVRKTVKSKNFQKLAKAGLSMTSKGFSGGQLDITTKKGRMDALSQGLDLVGGYVPGASSIIDIARPFLEEGPSGRSSRGVVSNENIPEVFMPQPAPTFAEPAAPATPTMDEAPAEAPGLSKKTKVVIGVVVGVAAVGTAAALMRRRKAA
jgi:hypothetical protein